MNTTFGTLCSISLLLGLGGVAGAQTAPPQGYENDSVIVSGGPGSGPGPVTGVAGVGAAVPTPGSPGVTNGLGFAPSLNVTNTNRFGTRFNAPATPGLGSGGAVGGSRIQPGVGVSPATPGAIIGAPAGTGANSSGRVGGLGTGSSGTGTGTTGVGGLGTGSGGIGTGVPAPSTGTGATGAAGTGTTGTTQ